MSAEPTTMVTSTDTTTISEKSLEASESGRAPLAEETAPQPSKVEGAATIAPVDSGIADSKEPVKVSSEKKVDFVPDASVEAPIETENPLAKLSGFLPAIVKEADQSEIWGVELKDATHVPTSIVLEKFLRANAKDVEKARLQLIEALKWRKLMDPKRLLDEVEFDIPRFGGLGFVTVYPKTETHEKEIVTWNIYGAVRNKKETFGNIEEFVRWRAALMELSVRELDLASATVPIPVDGVDPYRMIQVHDYLFINFLRMDPIIREASTQTIQIFAMAYPELLKEKFFVNVPVLMGWVFAAMKLFMAPETVKKFHPLVFGRSLAGECKGWGHELPSIYGGKGDADLSKTGKTVRYAKTTKTDVDHKAE